MEIFKFLDIRNASRTTRGRAGLIFSKGEQTVTSFNRFLRLKNWDFFQVAIHPRHPQSNTLISSFRKVTEYFKTKQNHYFGFQ